MNRELEFKGVHRNDTPDLKVRLLIEQGAVSRIIGKLPTSPSLAMVLWAHNPPGIGFDAHIELSKYLADKEPCIIVDDVFPKTYFKRSSQEQMRVNRTYSNFFLSRGCNLTFSSEIYSGKLQDGCLSPILEITEKLSLKEFLRALPESKMNNFSNLSMIELLHILNELYLLELMKERANLLIIPHFSQAIAVIHRNISQKPMSVVVTPTFGGNKDVMERISRIKNIAQL